MYENIILGTDGSETAAKALEIAIAVAEQNHSVLHIVNAYRSSAGSGPVVLVGTMRSSEQDLLQKRDIALKKYQAVIASNADSPPAEIARKYMREAYRAE